MDWFRDGFVIVELDDGRVVVERVEAADGTDKDWSCMACGYEVLRRSRGARLLDEIAVGRFSQSQQANRAAG